MTQATNQGDIGVTLKLYDLAADRKEVRFSPHCWRVRMALAHKGLEVECVAWRFTEKEAIAFSGQDKVPVLVDGNTVVADSWAIANHLEDAYPDQPSLFAGRQTRGEALFVKNWCERVVQPAIAIMIVADIQKILTADDQAYFRTSREQRFGRALEEVSAGREGKLPAFHAALDPLRATVKANPFIGGDSPLFSDYIVFGAFQWARLCSAFELLTADDPVHAWRDRMLGLFDGLARCAPGAVA